MKSEFSIPLIVRGKVIDGADLNFGGRGSSVSFTTPDVAKHLPDLMLSRPSEMADIASIPYAEILDYLEELGRRLRLDDNAHLQEALELTTQTSGLNEPIVRFAYDRLGNFFRREVLTEIVENTIGMRFLEGWVERPMGDGCISSLRAVGARAVHIIAGNTPGVASVTIVRNALVRSDAVIKTPSNDPATAVAIARTMIDMAPDHPVTKHVSVAYWKGGNEDVEQQIYQPANIEKIVAWGGFASIKHIAKYLQPGIDLVTLDPKLSSTIIGSHGFTDDDTMATLATLLAKDVGFHNQQACLNARVIYIQTGTTDVGLEKANRFGEMLLEEIRALPAHRSGISPQQSSDLHDEIDSLKWGSEWHKVIGGGPAGAVIVSQISEPVDFAPLLTNRVANLVPVDDLEVPIRAVNAYTQTIGIYPEALKHEIRDRLAGQGAQRLVSLGAATLTVFGGPQDGIEPLRRMCKWVVDERREPAAIAALTQ